MSKPRKRFASAEDMGRHFDEHEVTEANSTPARVEVDKRYDPTLTMRIPEEDLRALKALADGRGVPTATMGRMLLLEKLHEQQEPRAAAMRLLGALLADDHLRAAVREVLQAESPRALEKARRMLEKGRAA